jgi:CubicO group peptidase (beta-lactamase class C family)
MLQLVLGFALLGNPVNLDHMQTADKIITDSIARHETPGAVLLAGTHDRVVYRKAYGNRALEPATQPMNPDTIFDLASMTKSIATATSIMILSERGQIDLHAPVAKYIPEFGQNGKERITVEMLLLHRGGLVPDNPMSDYKGSPAESIRNVYALKPKWEPGTHFAYTDVGFIVLGQLVQAADEKHRPLNQFAREEIFEPLRMTETTFLPGEGFKPRIAPTEKRDGHFMIGEVHDPRAYALGGVAGHAGLFGTIDDVARWCQMLLNGGQLDGTRILKEETIREMTTMRCLPDGTGCRGYGLDINTSYSSARGDRFEPGTTFGHTGYTGTMFWIDPMHDCFFVLLTNRVHPDDKGDVKQLRRKVATIVAESFLGPAPASRPGS